MTTNRAPLATILALATAVTLSACASDSSSGMSGMDGMAGGASSTPADATDFNAQDAMFAQMMKPHHEQAVEMADIILAKDGISPDVTDLATRIKAAQEPEIDQLAEWIDTWGGGDQMSDMNDGMSGMMSDEDMSALDSAIGPDAENVFLEQMITHHEGAIEMAQAEIDGGRNAEAIAMAEAIVASQTEEIATMRTLLADR